MIYLKHYNIEKNKEVVIVTSEGEFPIWVKDFEKSFSGLSHGDEIENSDLLSTLAIRRHVKKKAIRRLTAGDITKNRLKGILVREKAFGTVADSEWIDGLLAKLEGAGYIDDFGYAVRYAEKCLEKSWGEMRIRASMHEKGFTSEHADHALEKLAPDFVSIAEDYIKASMAGCERDTVYRKLYQRGFKSDEIIAAIERSETDGE